MPKDNESPDRQVSMAEILDYEDILRRVWLHDHIGAMSVCLSDDSIHIMKQIIKRAEEK